MIAIPSKTDVKWTQTNTGEILGNLFATRNMSFDVMGYAKLARRSTALVFGLSGFSAVTSISTIDGVTYLVTTSGGMWFVKLDGSSPVSASTFGVASTIRDDGLVWNSRWYVSTDSVSGEIWDYDGSWHDSGISLTHGNPHPLCVHEELNYLIIGDGSTVSSYSSGSSTSHTLVKSIGISTSHQVRWIRYVGSTVYIGTRNTGSGEAGVFTWDGVSSTFTSFIPVSGSNWAFSACVYKGVLHVLSSSGRLLKYNGSGFDEAAHLPVYDTPYSWYDGNGYINGKVEQRGMAVKGDRIYINIDGYVNSSGNNFQFPNQPSGIWVYDENVGLYHKAGLSIDALSADMPITAANTVNSVLATSSAVTAPTGTKVFLRTSDIGGLSGNTYYFLIRISSNAFQLSTTYANAVNSVYITITSPGGGASRISMHNDVTFGQSSFASYAPGAVGLISDLQTSVSSYREYTASQILFGAGNVVDSSGNEQSSLQSLTQGDNRGSFVTTKAFSGDIYDAWQYLNSKYNCIFQGNDKIFIKYRITDRLNYPLSVQSACTWANPVTFTTSADLSSVSVGDEMEICSGRGSGCCAHVTSLSLSSGTWTVVLDDAIPGVASGDVSFDLLFQNWVKIASITSSNPPFLKQSVSVVSKWIQFKVVLSGVSEPFIEELQVINQKYIPSE